jgi:hypothetical protein
MTRPVSVPLDPAADPGRRLRLEVKPPTVGETVKTAAMWSGLFVLAGAPLLYVAGAAINLLHVRIVR